MKKRLQNEKGFTLAELLIVVAIIAVLVAISIPIFSAQLENAREAVDLANLRAAYAGVMVGKINNETTSKEVGLNQQEPGWQIKDETGNAITKIADGVALPPPAKGKIFTVAWDDTANSNKGGVKITSN